MTNGELTNRAKEFAKIRECEAASDFILDILDVIERHLMRLRVSERADCDEIVKRFGAIKERCDQDPGYCTRRTQRELPRTPTDLSEDLSERVTIAISPEMEEEYNQLLPNIETLPSQTTTPAGSVKGDDRSGTLRDDDHDASNAQIFPPMKTNPPPSINQPLPPLSQSEETGSGATSRPPSHHQGHGRFWHRMRRIVPGCFSPSRSAKRGSRSERQKP